MSELDRVTVTKSKLTDLADEIRDKYDLQNLMTIDGMRQVIHSVNPKRATWFGPTNEINYTERTEIPEEAYLITKAGFNMVAGSITNTTVTANKGPLKAKFVNDFTTNSADWTSQIMWYPMDDLENMQIYEGLIYGSEMAETVYEDTGRHDGKVWSTVDSAQVYNDYANGERYAGMNCYWSVQDSGYTIGLSDLSPKGSIFMMEIETKKVGDVEIGMDVYQLTRTRNARVGVITGAESYNEAYNIYTSNLKDCVIDYEEPGHIPIYGHYYETPMTNYLEGDINAFPSQRGTYVTKISNVPKGKNYVVIEFVHTWIYETRVFDMWISANEPILKNIQKPYRSIGYGTFQNWDFDLATLDSSYGKVLFIGQSAFNNNQNSSVIDNLVLNAITIGIDAFKTTSDVQINNLVVSSSLVCNGAFNAFLKLKNVEISILETVESSAFMGCTGLQSATVNSKVISDGMFRNCSSLATVTLGEGTTEVKSGAFRNCNALATFNIPSTITTMASDTFRDCNLSNTTFNVNMTQADFTALNLGWNWASSGATFVFTDTQSRTMKSEEYIKANEKTEKEIKEEEEKEIAEKQTPDNVDN